MAAADNETPWRFAKAAVIVGACAAAGVAFWHYHPNLPRLPAVFDGRLVHVLLFAALAWAAYFAGRVATRIIFRQRESYWEVDLAAGLFILGWGAFVLAAAHLLHVWVIRGITLVILGLSAPTLWRLGRGAGAYLKPQWAALTPGVQLLAAGVLPFAATLLVCVGEPPFHYDVLVYHLYLPKLFLARHAFVYLPRLAYASMPLGGEMTFTWAYGWDGAGVAAAVSALFSAVMVVATWRLARRYMDNLWATAAAAFLVFTPIFAQMVDMANTDFVLGAYALLALVVYLRGIRGWGDAALGGTLLGAALGVKYTGVHALAAFAPLLAWDLFRRRLTGRRALLFLGAAFVAVGPWLAKAYIERANPFFPALYGVFGGRDLSPEVAAGVVSSMREVGMGRGMGDYLLALYRASVVGDLTLNNFAGIFWPLTVVAVPFAFLWFRRWRLLLFTAFYFASWAVIGSQQLRFLGAALAMIAICIAGVAAACADAFRSPARAAARVFILASLLAFGYSLNTWVMVRCWARFGSYLGGDEAFLAKWASDYGADKYLNENTPRDAKVLMLFTAALYYLERPAVYDSFCDASETLYAIAKLKNAPEVAAFVERLGASYILINNAMAPHYWRYYDAATRSRWESYLKDYTVVVYQDSNAEVRAILKRE